MFACAVGTVGSFQSQKIMAQVDLSVDLPANVTFISETLNVR